MNKLLIRPNYIVMILAWIILSFVVAFIGSDRKIGYWGTFGLSLLLSPIVGALFALASQRIPQNVDENLPPAVYKYYNQARKSYQKGDYSHAIHFLNNAYEYCPNSKLVLFSMAVCYSAIKNKEKGFFYLDKAVRNGYSNFTNIQQSNTLEFLRKQPDFKSFVENGYRLPNIDNINSSHNDNVSKLEKLAELKEKGFLTEDEFSLEKHKILNVDVTK